MNNNNRSSRVSLLLTVGILVILAWGVWQALGILQGTTSIINGPATQIAQAFNPTPTIYPSPITIIHDVQALARLETIQYTVEKVITADAGQQGVLDILFGDKLLFVAHGKVIAGIDMSNLRADDLTVEGDTLYVELPEAEIFIATLDNEKSYVYDRETGFLNKGEVDLETTARQAAEAEILNAAIEDGILAQAQLNAENYLYRLFISMGYPDVVFIRP